MKNQKQSNLDRATELAYEIQDRYTELACEKATLNGEPALGAPGRYSYWTVKAALLSAKKWAARIPALRKEVNALRNDAEGSADLAELIRLARRVL